MKCSNISWMSVIRYILGLWFFTSLIGCVHPLPEEIAQSYDKLPQQIDFNFHVKPILSDKCFTCHGPDLQSLKAELRLDLPGEAEENGNVSGEPVIIPGKPFSSQLVRRILSEDKEVMMPPPNSHLTLSEKEIAILIKWIEQGAAYKPHWAFIKPEKTNLPSVHGSDWPIAPIDYFVLSKLEGEAQHPAEKAKKEVLIRRLYFNLTGLPPSPEAIEAFRNDDAEDAYEKVVDRLLASESYGERMAMEWLDIARYADSDGYLDDKHRDFTPWRDWVISAFNKNMPYDQFTSWLLAGDLIPDATQESILATAFNRLHKKNSEAGIVFEEYRTEYVADRTNTLGKAFLGLSVECARCHDHKYDPVSQEDYYQLFAFFNSTNEIGTAVYGPDQTPGPALLLTDAEQQKILDYTVSKIEKQEQLLQQSENQAKSQFQGWLADKEHILSSLEANHRQGLVGYFSFDNLRSKKANGLFLDPNKAGPGSAVVKEPEIKQGAKGHGVFLNYYTTVKLPEKLGWFERTDPFTVSLYLNPDTLYEEAGIFFHCEDFRLGLKGYSLYLKNNRLRFVMAHSWPQNAIEISTQAPLKVKEWNHISITYDGSSNARGITIYLDGRQVPVTVELDYLYKGITYQPDIHTYGFSGFTLGNRDKMKIFNKGGLDEVKIYDRALSPLEVLYDYHASEAHEEVNNWNSSSPDPMARVHFNNNFNPDAAHLREALHSERTTLNNLVNDIPEIMVMGDLPEPRQTYVLDRGSYDAKRQAVQVGVPEKILPIDGNLQQNRLGLVQWLFHRDHPLTSRVLVNRIWQMHFGTGIVNTPDDFGNQGSIPSHPRLLDWLAVEFIESGWDIKQLHKTIVMSATFQQSSVASPEMLDIDPKNQLLARGPSFRLKAEMIRDNALAISGLLVNKIGGSSAYPYQPEALWDEISNKKWRYKYLQQPGDGLYRRSLYTIWKRTAPPPSMLVFDAPGRSVCEVSRINTSTPLQALVLLNDPQYLEAARVLAEKLLISYNDDQAAQLNGAFSKVIGRYPDKLEMDLLHSFYKKELKRFSNQKQDAIAYTSIGEYPRVESLDPARVAALATVISGVLNTTDSYTLR